MYLAVGGVILRDEPPEGPAYERKELVFYYGNSRWS
jgi:hypothetical protein